MRKCSGIGFAAALLLILTTGCNQANKTVTLTYPPEEAEFTVAVIVDCFEEDLPDSERAVYIQGFDDQRSGGAVGEIKSALGGMMILTGEILKVSASGPAPFEASVALRIKLEKGERELLVSEYTGKGSLPNFRVLSANFNKSLGKALNEAVVNIARDVECVSGY